MVSISFPDIFAAETVVLSTRVMRNNINLIREWSGLPAIINKFTYGFFRPEYIVTPATRFTIDTKVIHLFRFGTYLLKTYEVGNMLKGTFTLFKILCALRIKQNMHKPVCHLARFQRIHVETWAVVCFLLH